ncbi:hypothetical protein GCM10023096_60230 [Nonomuraea ferruginea]
MYVFSVRIVEPWRSIVDTISCRRRPHERASLRSAVGRANGSAAGLALLQLPSDLGESLRHDQRALVRVEVLPPDATTLATARATESNEGEEGVQPMLGRDVEECAELDRCPDHHG